MDAEQEAYKARLMQEIAGEISDLVLRKVKQAVDLTEEERCQVGHFAVMTYAVCVTANARPLKMTPSDYALRETSFFHDGLKKALRIESESV